MPDDPGPPEVERTNEQERVRTRAAGRLGVLTPLSKRKAALAGAGLVLLAAMVTSVLLLSGGGDSADGRNPQAPAGVPTTPADLFRRMTEAYTEDGRIVRIRLDTARQSDGIRADIDVDALFDFRRGMASIGSVTTWENEPDDPKDGRELLQDGVAHVFYEGEVPQRFTADEIRPACLDAGDYLLSLIVCGVTDTPSDFRPQLEDGVEETTWAGAPALRLTYVWTITLESDGDGTPQAGSSGRLVQRYTYYVDAVTFLPRAMEVSSQRTDTGQTWNLTVEFTSEYLREEDVDPNLFDAAALGYRSDDQIAVDTLDGAVSSGNVVWLGRQLPLGDGRRPLMLVRVESRNHPERPELVAMDYSDGADATVTVAVWRRTGWDAFLNRLQDAAEQGVANFAFARRCVQVAEHEVNGRTVQVLSGVRSGSMPGSTPGACPAPDAFMAVIDVGGGLVVTFNAPIALFDLRPSALDSPAALLALAAGLKERAPGE